MSEFSSWLGDASDIFQSGAKAVTDVATTIANIKFGWQSNDLALAKQKSEIQQQKDQISFNNLNSETQLKLAKIQAASTLAAAQQGSESLAAQNIQQAIANLSAQAVGQNGGTNWVLWLTLAGVGFAGLQYFKGAK